jgi:hypothetical protein
MNKWRLQIRKGKNVMCELFPLSDQEHQRVTLQEGCSWWKWYAHTNEWKEHRMNPGAYVIILGYNDCAINTDTQHENLLKELEMLRKSKEIRLAELNRLTDAAELLKEDYNNPEVNVIDPVTKAEMLKEAGYDVVELPAVTDEKVGNLDGTPFKPNVNKGSDFDIDDVLFNK